MVALPGRKTLEVGASIKEGATPDSPPARLFWLLHQDVNAFAGRIFALRLFRAFGSFA